MKHIEKFWSYWEGLKEKECILEKFEEQVHTITSSYASFVSVVCLRDTLVLVVDWNRMISLNVSCISPETSTAEGCSGTQLNV